jgi:predicted nucleic acid-binding protein
MNVADTSFLFSLYGNDAHTPAAIAWVGGQKDPVTIGMPGRYELGNTLRFAAFRKVISLSDATSSLAAFESDIKTGHLAVAQADLAQVVAEAMRLSSLRTLTGGHRSFDILHVATASVLKATRFLTFDDNQGKLAASAGLAIGP